MPTFHFVTPTQDNPVNLVGGNVVVTISHNVAGSEDYRVSLFPFTPGTGAGAQIGASQMIAATGLGNFSVNMPDNGTITGPAPASNNREILVEQHSDGAGLTCGFRLGSGAGSGSGSDHVIKGIRYCDPKQLVRVAVTLYVDSKVTKGTCAKCAELNRPAILLHSGDTQKGGWYSRPIALDGKGKLPAYWVLRKSSFTEWTLVLQQGDKVLVTFLAKTKAKDCSLPINLKRKGAGTKACKDWPKSVTIKAGS